MAATMTPLGDGLDISRVERLFGGVSMSRGISYDVADDGRRILVVDDGAIGREPLTLLQNWTRGLEASR